MSSVEKEKAVASSLSGEVKEKRTATPPTLQEVLVQMNEEIQALKAARVEDGKRINEFLSKVEAAAQATPGARSEAAPQGAGIESLIDKYSPVIDRITSALGYGGAKAEESILTAELQKGYVLWLRQGLRSFNKQFGIPEHMTLG